MDAITLDLNFQGQPGIIASYLLPHAGGAVLIESGPGSTVPALAAGLAAHGFSPADVTDLFVTHIHLDHAGASGWLAGHGTRIHVHPRGLPHLADPSRLLASAGQIYADRMDSLWGETIPVPSDRLVPVADGSVTRIGSLAITAVDTPGHASHHHAFIVDGTCFSGDIGGVRLPGPAHVLLPTPPPEFHLETWRSSCERLAQVGVERIAPTHYGIYPDAAAHFARVAAALDETDAWLEEEMAEMAPEDLDASLAGWLEQRAAAAGLSDEDTARYETATPAYTSAMGLARYWRKFRGGER